MTFQKKWSLEGEDKLSHMGVNCAIDYVEAKLNIFTSYSLMLNQSKTNSIPNDFLKVLFKDKVYNFKGQFSSTRPI